MTKLMEWLLFAFLIFGIWIAIITGQIDPSIGSEWYYRYMPLILILLFGIYAGINVLYKVMTFNNCESAAKELQEEIKEAIADLESKGINLKNHQMDILKK